MTPYSRLLIPMASGVGISFSLRKKSYGFTIHVADVYIRLNPDTKQPDVSRFNHDIMTGGGMPFVPGAHPEYADFFAGLSSFDKEQFKRFRRRHPTLTNQEAMSMFKLNEGQSQRMSPRL